MSGMTPDRARLGLRGVGAAAAMVTITLLLMQIAHRLLDQPPEPEPAVAEAPATPDLPEAVEEPGLRIAAIEPVGLKVAADGQVVYQGVLCAGPPPGCPESTLSFATARELSVEVADLTRVRVIYNGSRVEPLGNLSASRRLVFIDDRAP